MKPVARIRTDFPTKFGIPRQSGMVNELKGKVLFEPGFRNPDALRGLNEYSHIWLIWEFSASKQEGWSPTVRPPRLGGNKRMGLFATRSPFRPNPIGLSSVRLERIEWHTDEGPVLHVAGVDLMDGTPILDIKPYIPYTDSHAEASGGFYRRYCHHPRAQGGDHGGVAWKGFPAKLQALREVLANDPRPSYQGDPDRVYGFTFAGQDVRFTVSDGVLTVVEVVD